VRLVVVNDSNVENQPDIHDFGSVLNGNGIMSHSLINYNRMFVYRVTRLGLRTAPQVLSSSATLSVSPTY
jgi:hypothetical protein